MNRYVEAFLFGAALGVFIWIALTAFLLTIVGVFWIFMFTPWVAFGGCVFLLSGIAIFLEHRRKRFGRKYEDGYQD